jgi:single-stranded-DNA-specific exonuclease
MTLSSDKIWSIPERYPVEIDQELAAFPPAMRQILFNRGIKDYEAARYFLAGEGELCDPYLLKDMDKAVARLQTAIDDKEPIAVYGDYDVDGVTATVLMVEVIRALGGIVQEYIPNRFDEGYGLNNDALDALAAEGTRVVVTVDCGIRSWEEAHHAQELGLTMIISDHHHPQGDVPPASAVICQKQDGDNYPNKNLAGVGLAYKIATALAGRFPQKNLAIEEWLDLVALGTVADIVPLTGENRMLVRQGLRRLREAKRPGAVSLANVAGVRLDKLSAADIGFMLGPRLNAAGRLESALASFSLLAAADMASAAPLAQKLDNQNRERQEITRQIQAQAAEMALASGLPYLLFAADPTFNQGVVGLAAAKLVEAYYRPAIVASIGEETTRGSCRSIAGFHITDALDECTDLLVRHGGHAMAAGFTVRNELMPELVAKLQAIAERELAQRDLRPVLRADVEIVLSDLKPSLLPVIDQLQPTGMENPDAVFVSRNLMVKSHRSVGADSKHLKLAVSDGQVTYDAIAFRMGAWASELPARVDLLYSFERNSYNGFESLQLNVKDLKPAQ